MHKAKKRANEVHDNFTAHSVLYEELLVLLIATHPNRDEFVTLLERWAAADAGPPSRNPTSIAKRQTAIAAERFLAACRARISELTRPNRSAEGPA